MVISMNEKNRLLAWTRFDRVTEGMSEMVSSLCSFLGAFYTPLLG